MLIFAELLFFFIYIEILENVIKINIKYKYKIKIRKIIRNI